MLQFDKKYADWHNKKTKFTRTSTLLQYNTTTQHAIDQFTSKNVSGQQKISKLFLGKCL